LSGEKPSDFSRHRPPRRLRDPRSKLAFLIGGYRPPAAPFPRLPVAEFCLQMRGALKSNTRGDSMNCVAKGFLIAAIVYGLLGMSMGLEMAISNNHGQMPTHAHTMVIGWISFFLFGLFYHQFGNAVSRVLSLIHFWVAQCALIGLIIGLRLVYSGHPQFEPIAAVSATTYALSFLVFAVAAIPMLWARKE
jgi:cbb3-type cytochrome oxidase subunit 1